MRGALILALAATCLAAPARAQDAAAGERVFAGQCKNCHQVGETAKNLIGPNLNGLFGRKAGSVAGYNYSPANKASDLVWDDTNFAAYIRDPKAAMPGTKMAYNGLRNDSQIADLAAYLHQFGADGKRTQ